jgi:hypothetical protein
MEKVNVERVVPHELPDHIARVFLNAEEMRLKKDVSTLIERV